MAGLDDSQMEPEMQLTQELSDLMDLDVQIDAIFQIAPTIGLYISFFIKPCYFVFDLPGAEFIDVADSSQSPGMAGGEDMAETPSRKQLRTKQSTDSSGPSSSAGGSAQSTATPGPSTTTNTPNPGG